MSGICGILDLTGAALDPSRIGRMTALLERRGPDGTHAWQDGPAALGHTLLATTPEALTETLPLRDPESGCVIAADCRLDNRETLLASLGLDRAGRVIGDGELILRAYLRWGEACPEHLLGDFAFAIRDPRQGRLFCARDHLGMRQLIYSHQPGRLFAFASEPRAVVAVDGVPRRLNEMRLAEYLAGLEDSDHEITFFQEVWRLPPAHRLTVTAGGIRRERYWTLQPGPPLRLGSTDEYGEAFREVFTQAVRCRLRSPGPVGAMLSGGMDSGSVVAVASRLLAQAGQGPLHTFSAVGPDPASCIETRTIHAALTMPGLAPTLVSHADLDAYLDDLIRLAKEIDEPFDFHMTLPRAVWLAGHRAGFRVMLDGAAGDVVLGHGTQLARYLRAGRWLRALRDAKGEERFWGPTWPAWRALAEAARTALAPDWLRRARRRVQAARGSSLPKGALIHPDFAARIGLHQRIGQLRATAPDHFLPFPEERARAIMSAGLTVGRERYDRVASAIAVEPRDPFMDIRVAQMCLALPMELLQRDGWPKVLLREAMAGLLPDEVRWRRGKEHLGWTFTKALARHWPDWRMIAAQADQRLAGMIAPPPPTPKGTMDEPSERDLAALEAGLCLVRTGPELVSHPACGVMPRDERSLPLQ
jgi:asparagine synthase (glutamine-hydrolysing)